MLGLPYMGSKRKIAKEILDYIKSKNPNCKYFFDLFGGGGAISFKALDYFENVHYNEFNPAIVNLLLKIRDEGVTDEFYKWYSRDDFNKLKDGTNWESGLIQTCWSFGNNAEKGYMYGQEIEPLKKLAHHIVVDKCSKSLSELNKIHNTQINEDLFLIDDLHIRRRYFCNTLKIETKQRQDLTHLECIRNIQSLQYMENLSRIKNLTNLTNLTNLSYEKVLINTPIEETIIYLDPPYEGTALYKKGVCHKTLLNWIKKHPYKIYVSSYDYDLPEVFSINHKSTLSATNNSKKVVEKLFCNKEETLKTNLFDFL